MALRLRLLAVALVLVGNQMKDRDPRRQPERGDIVSAYGEERHVLSIGPRGSVVYRCGEQERVCDAKSWSGWAFGEQRKVAQR